VTTPSGQHVPLGELATFEIHKGPAMVKSENARPAAWVLVDIAGLDVGTYVQKAQQAVARSVSLPSGYVVTWSGQYEYMLAAKQKLMIAVPLALLLIIVLLYMATRSWLQTAMVLLAEPFALVGAVWLVYLMGYNLSLAVWVGMIALAGLAA
jgi:Cu(I)/Ag(I) efflux system membrane protein CusA/SilA